MRLLAFLIMLSVASAARAETTISILTGPAHGIFGKLTQVLVPAFQQAVPGSVVRAEATAGSIENLLALQSGHGELAFAQGDVVSAAWKGSAAADFSAKGDRLRGVAALYPDYVQVMVARTSGIAGLADLKGKRVAVGMARSGTEFTVHAVLEAVGISYKSLKEAKMLPAEESLAVLADGGVDAAFVVAGLDNAAIRERPSPDKMAFLAIPPQVVADLNDRAYAPTTVPADTYAGQTTEIPTLVVRNQLVTRADVPDDVVYALTKALFDNLEQLGQAHPNGRFIKLDGRATITSAPLHPGAVRFYAEHGLMKQ